MLIRLRLLTACWGPCTAGQVPRGPRLALYACVITSFVTRPTPLPGFPSATRNRLLAAVAAHATDLMTLFELVEFRPGELVAEPDRVLEYAYFPETAVISLITIMRNGAMIEAAAIGNEGVVGLPLALSGRQTVERRTIAQVPGRAVRVPAAALRTALNQHPHLHALFLRYAEALLSQSMQSSGCTKLHSMPKRCARWLLMTHDRVGADTFWLTQQYLAFMLAVRRATVNAIAGALQREGLIRYQRGRVTVLDRVGLEAASCECYDVIRRAYQSQLVADGSVDAASSTGA
jgi:CRP-like cAMP-binding protein